jgi:hapalindole biogenesis HpiC1 cyclase-like protein
MRRILVLVTLAATLLWNAPAQETATVIPILNPQFQLDTLACSPGSGCNYPSISGWIVGPQTGILKASAVQYPGTPVGGIYVAYIGSSQATGSITQMLGATVQANTTYTLTVRIGARDDEVFTGYTATLAAGNVTLVSGNSAIPLGGKFVNEVIMYNSGSTPPQLGQPLQVFVGSMGTGQMNVSDVILTYKPE